MEEENGGANWRWTLPLFVLQGQDCYGMVLLASSVFISSYIALKSPWTDFQLLCVVGFCVHKQDLMHVLFRIGKYQCVCLSSQVYTGSFLLFYFCF